MFEVTTFQFQDSFVYLRVDMRQTGRMEASFQKIIKSKFDNASEAKTE